MVNRRTRTLRQGEPIVTWDHDSRCTKQHLTAAELAAFLGLSPSRIRHIVSKHHIQACGARWKAKLYHAPDVLQHAGTHDRQAPVVASESNVGHTQSRRRRVSR